MANFKDMWSTDVSTSRIFSIFFLNLNAVPTNLVPGLFGPIVQFEQAGVIAT